MDGGWRRRRGEINYRDFQRTRSNYRKPPAGSWQATVPSWEKKFCASVGSVPWLKILETKKCMHLYENVVQWNDSAGEEAFYNAKNRFWAKINGLPCDITLPDPDTYIDEIDWNPNIDQDLLLELEREPEVPAGGDKDGNVVILGNALSNSQSFSCTGWGEAEEDIRKVTSSAIGLGIEDCHANAYDDKNSWELNVAQNSGALEEDGWGNCWNSSLGLNSWENNINAYQNLDVKRTDRDWDMWGGNRRQGAAWPVSRYKTSKFYGGDGRTDRGWRNGRWRKRANFVY